MFVIRHVLRRTRVTVLAIPITVAFFTVAMWLIERTSASEFEAIKALGVKQDLGGFFGHRFFFSCLLSSMIF